MPRRGLRYCCGVGGDIYTFAGLLRGIPQRELHGATFIRVWEHQLEGREAESIEKIFKFLKTGRH